VFAAAAVVHLRVASSSSTDASQTFVWTAATGAQPIVERSRHGAAPRQRDARTYTFTYGGLDVAGLSGSCTATVVVPHDSGQ